MILATSIRARANYESDHTGDVSGPVRDHDDASSSLSPAQATPAAAAAVDGRGDEMDIDKQDEDEDSMDEVQPMPATVLVEAPTFGDDPTTFDDPTEYEIRKVQPGMTDEEIKSCASVAGYPRNDITHLTPGTPPDMDLTKGKPTSQVQASTFGSYIEPYFRPFTEEDTAFLRDRGDRRTPFTMPAIGKKHYKQVWAEEDGVEVPEDTKLPSNELRGSIEDMNDAVAETDQLSTGPVMARFLSLYRPEHRQVDESAGNGSGTSNGDEGGDNDDLAAILEGSGGSGSKPANSRAPFPPATRIPEPAAERGYDDYPAPIPGRIHDDMRILQELRYAGLIPPVAEPNYAASEDDQIAARMRFLQGQLKETMLENAARKSILQERMPDQMAFQEYNHIRDDLDGQVTSSYQKRTRTMSKKGKKRAGGPGGGVGGGSSSQGVAKPAVDSATKTAMERRSEWVDKVGPVFEGQNLGKVPTESIFTKEAMAKHIEKERAQWDDDEAEDADDE